MLLLGDCNHWLKEIKDESIDLIVSDPPYGIEFMGKDWDKALVPTETWKECFRVLKQGKLAFVMCSPRQDVLSRMIVNLQDAGFRTNYTSIYWTFASGFPKAANISKLLDKRNGKESTDEFRNYLRSKLKDGKTGVGCNQYLQEKGVISTGTNMYSDYFCSTRSKVPTVKAYEAMKEYLGLDDRYDDLVQREEAEREIIGKNYTSRLGSGKTFPFFDNENVKQGIDITKPATEEAKKMEGAYVGFQPKPAVEIILVVSKGKTLTWLDDCRIPYQSEDDVYHVYSRQQAIKGNAYNSGKLDDEPSFRESNEKGRFPANLLISDDVLNDGKNYKVGIRPINTEIDTGNGLTHGKMEGIATVRGYGDEGSYSRYFSLDAWAKTFPFLIVPKASRSERGEFNTHSTVKPLKLMSYLITMGSREGDLILDPFCGSGTVCIAAHQLHRKWLGIEMNPEYAEIIKKRLADPLAQLKLTAFA